METQIYLFQLSDDRSIIFRYNEFGGMVGETYFTQSYDLMNNATLEVIGSKRRKSDVVNFNILKEWYKRIEGKARRIEFWNHLQNFKPENIARQDEGSRADAISRVI